MLLLLLRDQENWCNDVNPTHQLAPKLILEKERFVRGSWRILDCGRERKTTAAWILYWSTSTATKATWLSRGGLCMRCTYCVHLNTGPCSVGKCSDCREDARQGTIAVAHGLFSISLTESIPDYSARYTNEQGNLWPRFSRATANLSFAASCSASQGCAYIPITLIPLGKSSVGISSRFWSSSSSCWR